MALRSISLPSRLDPTSSFKVEQDLSKLRALQQQAPGLSSPPSSLQARLIALADLYVSFTDLIRTPSIQQALLSHNQGQRPALLLQDTLDVSASLINACSSSRDLVSSLKGHARDLHSALRRSSTVDTHVAAYVGFRKHSNKEAAKCAKELNQMLTKSVEFDHAEGSMLIASVIRQVACVSISALHSLLSFLSVGSVMNSRWRSLISRRSKRDDDDDIVGIVDLDVWSMQSRKQLDLDDRAALKRRLGLLDCASQSLEAALDLLFKSLVQNRVSLLNILTH